MEEKENYLTIHELNLITEKEYVETIESLDKKLIVLETYYDKKDVLEEIDKYEKAKRLVMIAAYFGYGDKKYINQIRDDYELVMNYSDYICLVDSERIKRLYFLVKDHYIKWLGEDYLLKKQLKNEICELINKDKLDVSRLKKIRSQIIELNALDSELRDVEEKTK